MILFALILLPIGWWILQRISGEVPTAYYFFHLYFVLITGGMLHLAQKKVDVQSASFANRFIGGTGVKFFLSLVLVLVVGLLTESLIAETILSFAVLYLLFTGIEIVLLLKMVAKAKPVKS